MFMPDKTKFSLAERIISFRIIMYYNSYFILRGYFYEVLYKLREHAN